MTGRVIRPTQSYVQEPNAGPIVWLASYPKSGNTWLRVLLANYIRDADSPASINSLADESFVHAGRRMLFDELVGLEASSLDQATIDRTRPLAYRHLAREVPAELYVKVHDAWTLADDGNPIFPPDVSAGVVYIVRNPLDVAASFAGHAGVELETAVDWMCNGSFALFNPSERLGDQLHQRLSSWSGHVKSWLDHSGLPCVIVRYEDLHENPLDTLRRVVRFCGLPDDARRLGKAVAFSEFAELHRQEQANGFAERLGVSRGAFFRRGKVGGWREELPAVLARRLIEAHCATMRRFGYLDEAILAEVTGEAGIGSSP